MWQDLFVGTKFKVIFRGQGQISRSQFSKKWQWSGAAKVLHKRILFWLEIYSSTWRVPWCDHVLSKGLRRQAPMSRSQLGISCIMGSPFDTQLFTTQSQLLKTLKKKALENNVGKGGNAGNQHFLVFPQSANSFNLVSSKILSFSKE